MKFTLQEFEGWANLTLSHEVLRNCAVVIDYMDLPQKILNVVFVCFTCWSKFLKIFPLVQAYIVGGFVI